jgi:hypothetical protein
VSALPLSPHVARAPLRDDLGLALRELRRAPPCRALARLEWSVFVAVACHWRSHGEAWPSQHTIAAFGGYTTRVVPGAVATLERCGILCVRRRVGADGFRRMAYTPGPALVRALGELVGHPEIAAEVTEFPAELAEVVSTRPELAAVTEGKPVPLNKPTRRSDLLVAEPSDDAREIALDVLAEYFRRRHPGMAPVRAFDAHDVDAVARCARSVSGDHDAKLRALLDAVEGAFAVSPRPPTVRFVWGRIEHFLVHVERGRKARLRREREAAQPNDDAHRAVTPRQAATLDDASRGCVPREQLAADLARLFGPTWRSAR